MLNGLIGKKIGMTQIFKDTGEEVPVTIIETEPSIVLQLKSKEKDGYTAVQLGYGTKKEKSVSRPLAAIYKKLEITPPRFVKELKVKDMADIKIADKIEAGMFTAGEYVDITGVSIGKGFQGGMKRWHWKGGPGSHGSMTHRRPGSIGSSSDPSRVFKGHHLPGHMGNRKVTVQGLEIIEVDKDNNVILVKGAVPGKKGNYLIINKSFKKKKKEHKAVVHVKKKEKNPLKKSKESMKK
jgi:large subunit ribosomal protein L3